MGLVERASGRGSCAVGTSAEAGPVLGEGVSANSSRSPPHCTPTGCFSLQELGEVTGPALQLYPHR